MVAFLLPPLGSDENAPAISQRFNEVDGDLFKISESHGESMNGMVLNLDKEKMCAIFFCDDDPGSKFLVYIYIFQVSKLPKQQPRTKHLQMGSRVIHKDFLSVTCLHKGFYHLDECGCDLPNLIGAFYM